MCIFGALSATAPVSCAHSSEFDVRRDLELLNTSMCQGRLLTCRSFDCNETARHSPIAFLLVLQLYDQLILPGCYSFLLCQCCQQSGAIASKLCSPCRTDMYSALCIVSLLRVFVSSDVIGGGGRDWSHITRRALISVTPPSRFPLLWRRVHNVLTSLPVCFLDVACACVSEGRLNGRVWPDVKMCRPERYFILLHIKTLSYSSGVSFYGCGALDQVLTPKLLLAVTLPKAAIPMTIGIC